MDLLIKGGKAVTEADVFEADIGVADGKITAIGKDIKAKAGRVIDARGKYVVPGAIDGHTHMEFPFMGTTSADDFYHGTLAAACGGTTTIIDFALQRQGEGQKLFDVVDEWHTKADPKAVVDYGFHMIITELNETTHGEIKKVIEYGIPSFKCFMTYPGLRLDDGAIYAVMQEAAKHGGVVGLHCENNDIISFLVSQFVDQGNTAPEFHAKAKPPIVEEEAAARARLFAESSGCNSYVVHMSTGAARELVKEGEERGAPFWSETCPHYLVFTDEVYRREDGHKWVMSPPVKFQKDKEALWRGLASGDIKTVASDHCCFTWEQKLLGKDNFTKIPNGVPGTEVIIPILHSEGVARDLIPITKLVEVTSYNPANIFGLYPKKGAIAVGSDADLVIIDPEKRVKMDMDSLHSNIDYSIYEDFTATGYPVMTISRGEVVAENGEFTGKKGRGEFLRRKPVRKDAPRPWLTGQSP